MLDPNYLLHISEGAEEIAEQLHADIMRRIVKRIMLRVGRGEDYILTAQDKWQIENLQQAGYLLEDIQADIAKATKFQQNEIAEAMEDAGVRALDYDDNIYRNAGLSPVPLTQSPEMIRLMQRNYEATLGEWTNFTRTTANQAQRLYINQLDRAYNLVITGALSYTQAVKEIIDSVMGDDLKITYPTGHTDTIETATLRAIRTGISQATAQIQTARMDEMDVDLVITSSHLGARPSHQVWQGKIFSRSGKGKYPDFVSSTGYGSVSGLCGANCRHSFGPYFEGMDNPYEQYDSKENLEQYEREQRQRVLERRIRDTKRQTMALKEAVDSCKDEKARFALDMDYQRKAALLAKQNSAYADYCAENGLRPLSDRVQIARWDRRQAAAARGAAKRYENAQNAKENTKYAGLSFLDKKELIYKNETQIHKLQDDKKQEELKILMGTSDEMVKAQRNISSIESQISQLKKQNLEIESELGLPHNAKERFFDQNIDYSILPQDIRDEEMGAIGAWTRTDYTFINDFLRTGNRGVRRESIANAETLKKMISRNVVKEAFTVKRGTDFNAMNHLFNGDGWKKSGYNVNGRVITDKGFMATSPDIHGGFGGGVQMYIDVPKGAKGVYIGDLSAAPNEKEFLLQCGTDYIVDRIEIRYNKWNEPEYDVYMKVKVGE